ncbi:MAG: sialate O-acetylesterase [Eubacteriales bacterium]|nr:sialate O-acetylesterase [Eubacteriales bacterium]
MFEPAAIFQDHMVLCRRREICIFGRGENDSVITGELAGYRGQTKVRDGAFRLLLPPMEAASGLTLTLSDGKHRLDYCDVAIGEVFLAGGQSNMELELQNALNGPSSIDAHDDHELRFWNVPKQACWDAAAEKAEGLTRWAWAAPGALKNVSAMAYFFARRLRAHLKVPVGVIDCYWGGTSASCWMDEEALNTFAEGRLYLEEYHQRVDQQTDEQYRQELAAFTIESEAWQQHVDALRQKEPNIPWKRIHQQAGHCPWPPPMGRFSPYRPAGLCDTMLKRVAPYTLTAFLFYQGEEDTAHAQRYEKLLTAMIYRWRELFLNSELPFLNVQLPCFRSEDEEDDRSWPVVRQAQWNIYRALRHTGLAVTIDLGELDNIHPIDKEPVGLRLYQQALQVLYHEEGQSSLYAVKKRTEGDALVVTLSGPAHMVNGEPELLEIADERGRYVAAKAQLRGDELWLRAQGITAPVKARYAWVNYGKARLFGENGLPLAPFALE